MYLKLVLLLLIIYQINNTTYSYKIKNKYKNDNINKNILYKTENINIDDIPSNTDNSYLTPDVKYDKLKTELFENCLINDIFEMSYIHRNKNNETWKDYILNVDMEPRKSLCFSNDDDNLNIKIDVKKAKTECLKYETLYYSPYKIVRENYHKSDNTAFKPEETRQCESTNNLEIIESYIKNSNLKQEIEKKTQIYRGCSVVNDGIFSNNVIWWSVVIKNDIKNKYFEVKQCKEEGNFLELEITILKNKIVKIFNIKVKQHDTYTLNYNKNQKDNIKIKFHTFEPIQKQILNERYHIILYNNQEIVNHGFISVVNTDIQTNDKFFGSIMCNKKEYLNDLKKCMFVNNYKEKSKKAYSTIACFDNPSACWDFKEVDQLSIFNAAKLKIDNNYLMYADTKYKNLIIDYHNFETQVQFTSLIHFDEIEENKGSCNIKNIPDIIFENIEMGTLIFKLPLEIKEYKEVKVIDNNIDIICENFTCSFTPLNPNINLTCQLTCGLDSDVVPFNIILKNLIDIGDTIDIDKDMDIKDFGEGKEDNIIENLKEFGKRAGEFVLTIGNSLISYVKSFFGSVFNFVLIILGIILFIIILVYSFKFYKLYKKNRSYKNKEEDIEMTNLTSKQSFNTYYYNKNVIKLDSRFEFKKGGIYKNKEIIVNGLPYEFISLSNKVTKLNHLLYDEKVEIYDFIKEKLVNSEEVKKTYNYSKYTINKEKIPFIFLPVTTIFKLESSDNDYELKSRILYYKNEIILNYK